MYKCQSGCRWDAKIKSIHDESVTKVSMVEGQHGLLGSCAGRRTKWD